MMTAYVSWVIKQKKHLRVFQRFQDLGFDLVPVNESTKWFFTELVPVRTMNGLQLRTDISRENGSIVEIHALVESELLSRENYNELRKRFSQSEIEFGLGSILKKYRLNEMEESSGENLEREIKAFTEQLLNEGFKPDISSQD